VVALDLIRRGLLATPLVLLAAGIAGGAAGVASAAIALAIVFVNFTIAAASIGWAARFGGNVVAAVVMGGYLVRLALLGLALYLLRRVAWIDDIVLGVTLVVTYLGLLVWETRYVSMSLAFPGLKPEKPRAVPGEG
jgi:hypothetical protein